jgi:hypothetical protein
LRAAQKKVKAGVRKVIGALAVLIIPADHSAGANQATLHRWQKCLVAIFMPVFV